MSSRSSEGLKGSELFKREQQRMVSAREKSDIHTFQQFRSKGRQLANPLATKGKSIASFKLNRVQALRLGLDPDEMDSLVNSFLGRQRQIQQRRAQPGRGGLFLARSS